MRLRKCLVVALALVLVWCELGASCAYAATYSMPYYIDVDLTNQTVTVYNTKDGSIARQMLCSAGTKAHTPTGTWYMPAKDRPDERTEWYWMPNAYTWVKYPSKIYYAYFFHSVLFRKKDDSTLDQQSVEDLGLPVSHGCIRLRIEDAKFIADNCLQGTRVRIFNSEQKNEELRQLLHISSYRQEDGITYQQFLGISPDALSSGASGTEVQELQQRLHDLGYYEASVDGRYATETIVAVKTLQQDLGIAQTGITTAELKEVIFSEEAPVSSGNITIKEGESGPVVKRLQAALKQLGFYVGEVDSVYDADVIAAVKELQRVCGYDTDGVATPEIQHLIYYELNRMQQALGEDFTAEQVTEEINYAKMNFKKSKINVRAKPNTKSDAVTQLSYGDSVLVLATKNEWAQVIAKNKKGYMLTKYLEITPRQNYLYQFSGNGQTITLGTTLEQMLSGNTTSERETFRQNYNTEQALAGLDESVEYATVNTGSEGVKLNMRADASSEASILAEIPNGTKLRVLAKTDDWTRVGYDDQIGYLMNQYLSFSEGSASEVQDTSAALSDEENTLIYQGYVQPNRRDGTVPIYKSASNNSKILCTLGGGREVWVLAVDEDSGWAHVRYGEKEGYMQDKNLVFRLDTAYTLQENGELVQVDENGNPVQASESAA